MTNSKIETSSVLPLLQESKNDVQRYCDGLYNELAITGFSYAILDANRNTYSTVTTHPEIFEGLMNIGFLSNSPFIDLPEMLPRYTFNDYLNSSKTRRSLIINNFMQNNGINRVLFSTRKKLSEYHFSAFYMEDTGSDQLITLVNNFKLLDEFQDHFYTNTKEVIVHNRIPVVATPKFKKKSHLYYNYLCNQDYRSPVLSQFPVDPSTINNKNVKLTRRENQILLLYANGMTSNEISAQIYIARKTVERHICNAKEKIGCKTKIELYRYFNSRGLLV